MRATSATLVGVCVVVAFAAVGAAAAGGLAPATVGDDGGIENESENETAAERLELQNLSAQDLTLRNVTVNRLVVNVTDADGEQRNLVLEGASARRVHLDDASVPNATLRNATLDESFAVAVIGRPAQGDLPDFPTPPEAKPLQNTTVDGVLIDTLVVANGTVDGLSIENETDAGQASASPELTAERLRLTNATVEGVTVSGWTGNETSE